MTALPAEPDHHLLRDEILRAMRAGHAYANVHTTFWPAGEIRGQINDEDQTEFDT